MISELKINRYIFEPVKSNMYVVICDHEAIIVDPNISEAALEELRKHGVNKATIILTHEHYDHTTGVNWFKEHIDCTVLCHTKCAERIKNKKNNRPIIIGALLMEGKINRVQFQDLPQAYVCTADETFEGTVERKWCGHKIKIISTPGHTDGSCCIELDDQYVFTGDSLIKNTKVITPYPSGSIEKYHLITMKYLKGISKECKIMPGHGETFYMKEIEL